MNKQYYADMLRNGRMFFYKHNGKLICIITYYIGIELDENRFIRDNPWEVVEDNPNGSICYIDHCIANKILDNKVLSFKAYSAFKKHIISIYPNVGLIRWNRFKNNKVFIHKEVLHEGIQSQVS